MDQLIQFGLLVREARREHVGRDRGADPRVVLGRQPAKSTSAAPSSPAPEGSGRGWSDSRLAVGATTALCYALSLIIPHSHYQ